MNSSLKAYLADQQSLALSLQYCATAVENLLDAGLGESLAASVNGGVKTCHGAA